MTVGAAYGVAETRIRATVSVVAPAISASTQGIAASAAVVASTQQSSLTKLNALVQHVVPAALLKHVHIVLSVALDPIGRNPFVEEFKFAVDTVSLGVAKAFYEVRSVADVAPTLVVGKGIVEPLVTTEVRTLTLQRTITDAPIIGDAAGISFVPAATLDSFHVGDSASLGFITSAADRVSYGDGPNQYDTYALSYFAADYVREGFPAIGFFKRLADTVYSTDDFYGVANADDDETMSFSKVLADNTLTTDTLRYSGSKQVSDLFGKSDAATIAASKTRADSFTTLDAATTGTGKGLTDTFTSSEIVVRGIGKAASDIAATAETRTFVLAKSLSDTVVSTDDFFGVANTDDDETMLFAKAATDTFTKSDSVSKGPGKGLVETASTTESGSMVWTDYWDINYTVTTSGPYVGTSRTF